MSYELIYPPRICFGWGIRRQLAELLPKGASYALLAANSQVRRGIPAELAESLGSAAFVHQAITPDPLLSDVDEVIEKLRAEPVDAVIAIGGGSVIDVAKAAAVLAPRDGCTREYFYGDRQIEQSGLPLYALPTTAGTGAEITKNAVLMDPENHVKQSIRHPVMVPRVALVDPELTLSLPPGTTAASGLDALTQAIESYLSAKANAVTMALARQAVQVMMPALPVAFGNGQDEQARTRMAEGSMLTALAFSQSGLGAVHGLAHPLGALLHQKHGLTCAVLLPYILEFNARVSRERLKDLAQAVGLSTAEAFVEQIARLVRELDVPQTFAYAGLQEEHFDFIVEHCRSNSMRCNPREMSDDQVRELLVKLAK